MPKFNSALLFVLLSFFSLASNASLITYKFEGQVLGDIPEISEASFGSLQRPVGESVFGEFSFDPESWIDNSSVPGSDRRYNSPGYDHGIAFVIGGVEYDSEMYNETIHRIIIKHPDYYIYDTSYGSDFPFEEPTYKFIFSLVGLVDIRFISDPIVLGNQFSIGRLIEYDNN